MKHVAQKNKSSYRVLVSEFTYNIGFCVDTAPHNKHLIVSCNVPEVDSDGLVGSSVGQDTVGGHVHGNTVVSDAHVTSGHGVVTAAVLVTSGHCVLPSDGIVVSVMYVLVAVVLVVSEVNVVSSVGQVHGNTVGSVVPAGETTF